MKGWLGAFGIIAGLGLAALAYILAQSCLCPGGFSCPAFCTHPDELWLFVVAFSIIAISAVGLILSLITKDGISKLNHQEVRYANRSKKIRRAALQVLGGLLVSSTIFLLVFVTILGPLIGYVYFINKAPLWALIVYVPYSVIGSVSFVRNLRAFGLTIIISGLIAMIFFYGFVNGLGGSFV